MKALKYTLAFLGAATLACACTNEDPDYFDKAAAYRMDDIKTETKKLLTEAPNGWELQYFTANDWEPGYTILMRFNSDQSVEMAANNIFASFASGNGGNSIDNNYAVIYTPKMFSDISLWKMVSDAGPVLTFDTYNNMLHPFSDPYDVPLTANNEAGNGHEGDYEFIVMARNDSVVSLRGKKTEVNMLLKKLPEGLDWNEYLAKIRDTYLNTFSPLFPTQVLTIGSKRYIVSGFNSGLIDVYAEGDDALTSTTTLISMPLADGYRLREPFNGATTVDGLNAIDGLALQEFHFGEDGLLHAPDAVIEPYYTPAQLFPMMAYKNVVSLKEEDCGPTFYAALDAFAAAVKKRYKQRLATLQFYYSGAERRYGMQFIANKGIQSTAPMIFAPVPSPDGDNIRFELSSTEGNLAGNLRLKDMDGLHDFITFINARTWKVTSAASSPYCPTRMRLTDVADPDCFFTVDLLSNK